MYSLSQYYKLLHQNEDKAKKVSDTINRRRDEDRKNSSATMRKFWQKAIPLWKTNCPRKMRKSEC